MIDRLVVFGATGDLTGRYLLPALAQLSAAGSLPDGFSMVGAAQESWDEDAFRRHAAEQLDRHGPQSSEAQHNSLVGRLSYRQVDVTDSGSVAAVVDAVRGSDRSAPVVAYLALPTGLMPTTLTALGAAGLPPGSRVAVEKPFGGNLAGAREMNRLLAAALGNDWERAVFRVDHALGMTAVQNLVPLRFANRMLEAVWNSDHVAEVEVLWEETLALEGRAAFYDRAGALTDVMQNHMMQVFCMAAMEPPDRATDGSWASVPATELSRRKVELLRAVREPSVDDIIATSRRGRYTAGRLAGGQQVPDYAAEAGVDPDRNTETFAEVVLAVDNQRWSGTNFRFRAGKALAETRKGIRVRFRPGRAAGAAEGEQLWLGIDGPNDVSLRLNAIPDDDGSAPAAITLTGRLFESRLSPYAQVLLNVMKGGSDLSVGSEEAEQAWRIFTPVHGAWERGLVPLRGYSAGSATI